MRLGRRRVLAWAWLSLPLLASAAEPAPPARRSLILDDPDAEPVTIQDRSRGETVRREADGSRVVRSGHVCLRIPTQPMPWQDNPAGHNLAVPSTCP